MNDDREVNEDELFTVQLPTTSASSSTNLPRNKKQSPNLSTFPADTVYRCAHCSYVDKDQARVVAHAKNCFTQSSLPQTITLGAEATVHFSDVDFKVGQSSDSEPERRGRGLPLWNDKKIGCLLEAISNHVNVFSEDIVKQRRAWKLIAQATKRLARFNVNTKHCAYKWSKLVAEYENYTQGTTKEKPAFYDKVHEIVSQNQKILKKPDTHSYIKTITCLPCGSNYNSQSNKVDTTEIQKSASNIEQLTGEEIDLFAADFAAEILTDDHQESDMKDCAQISISEIGFEEDDNTPYHEVRFEYEYEEADEDMGRTLGSKTRRARPTLFWTNEQARCLLKIIDQYKEKLFRTMPSSARFAWAVVAEEVQKVTNLPVSGMHCHQKWRYLVKRFCSPSNEHIDFGQPLPVVERLTRQIYESIKQMKTHKERKKSCDAQVELYSDEHLSSYLKTENMDSDASENENKSADPDLLAAKQLQAMRNREKKLQEKSLASGNSAIWWTNDRVQVLMDTISDCLYLLQCPETKVTDAWKFIASNVSQRGGFEVSGDRCVRKFRQLISGILMGRFRRGPEPHFITSLKLIIQSLPPDCRSFPARAVKALSRGNGKNFFEIGDEALRMNGATDNEYDEEDEDEDFSNREESSDEEADRNTATDRSDAQYKGRKRMLSDSCEIRQSVRRVRRKPVRFLEEGSDKEETQNDAAVESGDDNLLLNQLKRAATQRRSTAGSGDDDEEEEEVEDSDECGGRIATKKRPRLSSQGKVKKSKQYEGSCCCGETVQRLQRDLVIQQKFFNNTIERLVNKVNSVDDRLNDISSKVSNFLAGFLTSFGKLVDTRVNESISVSSQMRDVMDESERSD